MFYQNADLASYSELVGKGTTSISQLLNDAWQNAQNYPPIIIYEITSINNLRSEFGLPKI